MRGRIWCASIALGVGSVFAAAAPAMAATVSCGEVVTASITVHNDLVDCPGHGLIVGAPNITIDLAGHTIDGSGGGHGIRNNDGHDGVVVRRGTITGFGTGVLLRGQDGGALDRLTVTGNGLGTGGGGAALFDSPAVVIDRGSYSANGFGGINLLTGSPGVRISRIAATGNENVGIAVQGGSHGVVIDRVDAGGNGAAPAPFQNCRCGIFVGNSADNARVSRVVANGNGWFGVWFAATTGSTLTSTEADANGIDGVRVSVAGNTLSHVSADDNAELGIRAVPGTIDGGHNSATGNGNPAQCTGVACG